MRSRVGSWVAQAVARVRRRWFGDRDTRRTLELRVEALMRRFADDARRLREQEEELVRLRAIVRQHAEAEAAASREQVRIGRAQAEIRRLAELRRQRRGGALRKLVDRRERGNGQGAPFTLAGPESAAPRRESDPLMRALRESLKQDRLS